MKTVNQVINEYKSKNLDSRDLGRLCEFLTIEECKKLNINFKENYIHKKLKNIQEKIYLNNYKET